MLVEFSDSDVPILLGEIAKRMMARQHSPAISLLLRDSEDHPVGYFVPQTSLRKTPYRSEEEFIKELKHRIANPPDRFLSTDELVAQLERH